MRTVTVNVEAEFVLPGDYVVESNRSVYMVGNAEEFHTVLWFAGGGSLRLPKVTYVTVTRPIGSESDD